uniref:Uncharacterized protein n=1 Tax=Bicosoecida sp. CB-2014 TaxID=1486930 RepID=A0A7S1CQE1_9STRA|mmetsp:Transcript_7923/g.28159  ORF Transcript_7923/g.28159 Transcript_7923/m.28159 type:complete len:319 (+) Transcript_7923:185-1141(+)
MSHAAAGAGGRADDSDDEFDRDEAARRAAAVAESRKEAKKILMGQYTSNISFGSEDWVPEPGHASEFRAYDLTAAGKDNARSEEQKKDQTAAHYEFGMDPLDYRTTATDDFSRTDGKPARLSEMQKAEVRSVHFVLGNEKTEYTTEAKAQFKGGPMDKGAGDARAEAAEFKRDLRATHYEFGADEASWETTGGDFTDVSSKITAAEREKTREGIRVQTTLLRASNIAFSSHREFYADMRERMPDPTAGGRNPYAKDPQVEETVRNARFDSVCLGEDEDDWATTTMLQNGEKKKRIGRKFKPPLAKAKAEAEAHAAPRF